MPILCRRQNIKATLARMVFFGRHQSFPAIVKNAFISYRVILEQKVKMTLSG